MHFERLRLVWQLPGATTIEEWIAQFPSQAKRMRTLEYLTDPGGGHGQGPGCAALMEYYFLGADLRTSQEQNIRTGG